MKPHHAALFSAEPGQKLRYAIEAGIMNQRICLFNAKTVIFRWILRGETEGQVLQSKVGNGDRFHSLSIRPAPAPTFLPTDLRAQRASDARLVQSGQGRALTRLRP